MAKVVEICISEKKGTEKKVINKGILIQNFGLENDAHAGDWHRQISLLEVEKIDEFNERGGNVEFGAFGENIITEGINLTALSVGDVLKIGDATLEITQKGKQCHQHCQIFHRVGDCIMPREGIFAKVITGGVISSGSTIDIL